APSPAEIYSLSLHDALPILGAIAGGVLGVLGNADALKAVTFQTAVFKSWMPVQQAAGQAVAAIQPIWPMLFVTIACGAISGWHRSEEHTSELQSRGHLVCRL